MVRLLQVAAAVFVGVVLGLVYTSVSLRFDRGIVVGPWHGTPREGTQDINPYALAAIARDGLLPLGAAEGLSFIAEKDNQGEALSPACDYVIKGPMPTARFWTVSLLGATGFPVANAAARYGFTSAEVLRLNDRHVVLRISRKARSGNWLPIGNGKPDSSGLPLVFMLRLYDTGLSTIGTSLNALTLPAIEKQDCR